MQIINDYIDPDKIEDLEEQLVKLTRTSKVVKGGRRFRFSALMVVGNKNGIVGIGQGKANEIPDAIKKSVENAKRSLIKINLNKNTIPHTITRRFCSSKVWMKPATEGTGIIAGRNIRSVLEYAGIKNILTKTYGSRNTINATKAAFECLKDVIDPRKMAEERGYANIMDMYN